MNTMIRILVHNRPGVLDRIAGIVRRQGWNIECLTAGNTTDDLMQINLSVIGQHINVSEFGERLSELYDVESWEECSPQNHLVREILLFRYHRGSGEDRVVSGIAGIKTIEEADGIIYAEYTGSSEETAVTYDLLQKNAISCIRIGKMILAKGGGNPNDEKRCLPNTGN